MDTKIKTGLVQSYTTTDGKIFAGEGSKKLAKKYQWSLDKRALSDEFDAFMRKMFGLSKHSSDDIPEEEEEFCNNMMKEVNISAEGGDFTLEVSEFILDLFGFIGPKKWSKIQNFLTEKEI